MTIYFNTADNSVGASTGKTKTIEAKDVTLRGQFGHIKYDYYWAAKESNETSNGFIDEERQWRESLEDLKKARNLDELNLFAKEVKRTRAYARIGIFLDKQCSTEEPEFEFRVKLEHTFKGVKKVVAITDTPSEFSFTIQTR